MVLEKSLFGSHYSNGGFRQESSVFDKSRGQNYDGKLGITEAPSTSAQGS